MKKIFIGLLACALTVSAFFTETYSVDAMNLNADASMDSDVATKSSDSGDDLREMDLGAVTSADIYAPAATDEVYTIYDAYVSAELSAADTINFVVSNRGFATIKEW